MLHFAVAGSPSSTPGKGGIVEGLKQAHALGIDAMEIEWVQNVPGHEERMMEIRTIAKELGITLTVHAPYYVNFNSLDHSVRLASVHRVVQALRMAEIAGAVSVCVHAAFNMKQPPAKVYASVQQAMAKILKQKEKLFPHVNLAVETMGKSVQFGSLEEALKISAEFGQYPCVDFAHLHARGGLLNSAREWEQLLDQYQEALGKKSLQHMHIHYSGIQYGPGGERKHLRLEGSDANWKDFLNVLKKRRVGGVLVCESPDSEKDTLLLRRTFDRLEV